MRRSGGGGEAGGATRKSKVENREKPGLSAGTLVIPVPRESRVGGDVDAVELAVRMERAYVRPDVRALAQVVLTIRALETLRRAAFVSVMPRHVTAVLVAAVAPGAVVAISG